MPKVLCSSVDDLLLTTKYKLKHSTHDTVQSSECKKSDYFTLLYHKPTKKSIIIFRKIKTESS
jgi:hypothetical protein